LADSNIKFYDATGWKKGLFYPYILASTSYVSDMHAKLLRSIATTLIVDCDIRNENTTNKKVYEKATIVNADYVVPKDYIRKPEETVHSIVNFVENYVTSGKWEKDLIIPVQPAEDGTYDNCINLLLSEFGQRELKNMGGYIGLGGLKGIEDKKVQCKRIVAGVKLIHSFGFVAHLFGVYPGTYYRGSINPVFQYIRSRPAGLASLDSSVTETMAVTGRARDFGGNIRKFPDTRGDESVPWKVCIASANAWAVLNSINRNSRKPKQSTIPFRNLK